MAPAHRWTQPLSPMDRKDKQHATEHLLRTDIYPTWCCSLYQWENITRKIYVCWAAVASSEQEETPTAYLQAVHWHWNIWAQKRFSDVSCRGTHRFAKLHGKKIKKRHYCLIFKHTAYNKQLFVQKKSPHLLPSLALLPWNGSRVQLHRDGSFINRWLEFDDNKSPCDGKEASQLNKYVS